VRWLAKAAVQGTISRLPRSNDLNYSLQTKVSRSLPQRPSEFELHVGAASRHLAALDRLRPGTDRSQLRC
jgi:hypothetical protein